MTDFFTRYCKKFSLLAVMAVFFCIFDAAADNIQIKHVQLTPVGESYQLEADFDINFSPEVETALSKGVPLDFLLEFQLVSPRDYWFDDEIVTVSQHIRFSFHALSRQYLVTVGRHQKSFATLEEAKDELAVLRNWLVLDKSQVVKGENYQASLRLRLDHASLPKALQVEALGSEKWTLLSERYRWTPVF